MDIPADAVVVTPPAAGTDAAVVIQKALDTSRKIVLDGTFDCKNPILLSDGQQIWGRPGANLYKSYDTTGATSRGFIRNRDFKKHVRDVIIAGVDFNIAARPKMGGNMLSLLTDNFLSMYWHSTYWTGGRMAMIGGDLIRFYNHKWECASNAGSGVGGLRFAGGDNFIAENLDVTSGDDVFQFVPAGVETDPLFNCGDTTNSWYRNCVGKSLSARLCIAALQDANNNGTKDIGMKVSIYNSGFENIYGEAGGSAVVVKNSSSIGSISDLRFKDVVVDQYDAEEILGQPAEVYLLNYAGLGPIYGIDFSGLGIRNPKKHLFRADGDGIYDIKFPNLA